MFCIIFCISALTLTALFIYHNYYEVYELEQIEKESIISLVPQLDLQINPKQQYTYKEESNNQTIDNKKNSDTSDSNTQSDHEQNIERDVDCIINIPDIDLTKKVYTGNNREKHLDNYELITATPDMKYSNGGNYIICGHASQLYGHSLNRLSEVLEYTRIQIWANNEVENYVVKEVKYVNMHETSEYCNQTRKKQITILSCAKNISPESYIVVIAVPN